MKRELIITDDAGFLRRCSSVDEIRAGCDIIASATPDIVAIDTASPDMTVYQSEIAQFIAGEPFKTLLEKCDPIAVAVERLKERGIKVVSNIRMNDHHGKLEYWTPWEREHVDWSLGEDTGSRDWKSIGSLRKMDYSIPGVRKYRLSILEEIIGRFEIDGLQLDFNRSAPFVSSPKRDRGKYLTEYLRSVRKASKDLILGVLVPWDYEFCRSEGLDIETWIDEKLIDYVSPGEWYYADWNLCLDPWISLTQGTDCRFYPFMPGNVSPFQSFEYGEPSRLGENNILQGPKIRAIADNYIAQGCDGISFYNFYTFDFGAFYPELRSWIDPEQSKDMSRHYLNCRKTVYHANERDAYDLGTAFKRRELDTSGDSIDIPFRFSTDMDKRDATLRLAIVGRFGKDRLEVAINDANIDAHSFYREIAIRKKSLAENAIAAEILTCRIPMPVVRGDNILKITLSSSDPHRRSPILAGEFEILIPHRVSTDLSS